MKVEFDNAQELLALCKERDIPISQTMMQMESHFSEREPEEILNQMRRVWEVMKQAVARSLSESLHSMGGLLGGEATRLKKLREENRNLCGNVVSKAVSYAMGVMEVNASMGLIVAAPTAGSCGILPGVLTALQEEHGFTDEQIVKVLFNAGAIGMLVQMNATVAGAEGGCQAETGAAAAMAASAVCELMGYSPLICISAASTALKNVMGLICDPVAGLVEAPCQKRNAIGAANALVSAEISMAGISSIIPLDETIAAMFKVGKMMPSELRETALGGVAMTETGQEISRRIFDAQKAQ